MIIDDTGFPKKGKQSVGVTRQYCGQLGKQDDCQVAVSVSLANENFSLPVRYQLYLPQSWADDADRRKAAKVPEALEFVTKPMLALQLLENLAAVDSLPVAMIIQPSKQFSTHLLTVIVRGDERCCRHQHERTYGDCHCFAHRNLHF